MGREERKLKKHLEQREQTERRKLAQKTGKGQPALISNSADEGLIVEVGPSTAVVRAAGESVRCKTLVDVAVGDRVRFSAERRKIDRVLPRTAILSRPDPNNPRIERVIAANIELVVNVVSLQAPPLSPGLIDRYLIAIEQSGADPLICVNKTDLEDPGDILKPYEALGVPVVYCSAATGAGLDTLRAALAGRLCVFTGHSGVGKSSLLNALDPNSNAATGDVSAMHHKGKHTTTSSKLYDLPNGAVIIDTPGIRELGLWNLTPREIRLYFHEFDEFARDCAFGDCTHTHEPRCAVQAALKEGRIPAERYASYLRIMNSTQTEPLP